MKFILSNVVNFLVLVLVGILFIQRCSEKPVEPIAPTVVRDTVYVVHDSVIYTKPQVIQTIRMSSKDSLIYLPDSNYAGLVLQYQEAIAMLLAKNVQKDSIPLDSVGYVKVVDTVQKNLIVSRKYQTNLKYPIIKETITLPYKPVNQVYVGGDITGSQTNIINQVRAGLLFKNKKDQIFTGSIGLQTNGQVIYGVGSYWKIKLK